jgi:hypothetical protein
MAELNDLEKYLRSAFPAETDALVLRAVREAVVLADDLRSNTHWLQSLVGSDLAGLLRRAAIMWRLHEYSKAGELPFRADEIPNSNGSSHLLRIRSGPFEAHVVRTETAGAFPVDAPIRQDHALRNDADLFDDDPKIVSFNDMISAVRQPYAWLSFNATPVGMLTHVCWCMPKAKERVYLARFNILRSAAVGMPALPPEPPKPDPTEAIKFKKHIEEQIERNKKEENKGGK